MKKASGLVALVVVAAAVVACGAAPPDTEATAQPVQKTEGTKPPATGPGGSIGGAKVDPTCTPSPEKCEGGQDEDCDGKIDCGDPDCSGVGSCPVCGAVEHPEATPLALPDGNDGAGVPYESKLTFTGFGKDKNLDDVKGLVKVCVTMEHSWLRDLEIKLISPSGKEVILTDFRGRSGSQIKMGKPNERDSASAPVAGSGAEYCWAADATKPAMLDSDDAQHLILPSTLDPGTYKPAKTMDTLVGSPLNGVWTMRVTDRWTEDNGFIFAWSIAFDPKLVADCTAPLVVDQNPK